MYYLFLLCSLSPSSRLSRQGASSARIDASVIVRARTTAARQQHAPTCVSPPVRSTETLQNSSERRCHEKRRLPGRRLTHSERRVATSRSRAPRQTLTHASAPTSRSHTYERAFSTALSVISNDERLDLEQRYLCLLCRPPSQRASSRLPYVSGPPVCDRTLTHSDQDGHTTMRSAELEAVHSADACCDTLGTTRQARGRSQLVSNLRGKGRRH